jgi:hypothetical protein
MDIYTYLCIHMYLYMHGETKWYHVTAGDKFNDMAQHTNIIPSHVSVRKDNWMVKQ